MPRYRPGDIVSRRKGLVMHKGVVMRDGRVLHNTPFVGEHATTMSDFSAGKRVYVERQNEEARRRALRLSEEQVGRGYHLLRNNCEHTVHRATTGRAESPQLQSWLVGIGVGAVAFAATRHPAAAAAGYAFGRGLLARLRKR
jgi:hypothetical protein